MRFVPDIQMAPRVWHVCFVGRSDAMPWDRFLKPGYRHVFLLGYLPEQKLWLRYEVLWGGTEITLMSGEWAGRYLSQAMDDGGVLSWPAADRKVTFRIPIALYCVSAVCHALGLRCVALTPHRLYRWLLRNGAKPLREDCDEPVQR